MRIHIFSSSEFHFKNKTYFFVMANHRVDLDESDSMDSGVSEDFAIVDPDVEGPASPRDSGCTPTSGCYFYGIARVISESMIEAALDYRRLYLAKIDLETKIRKMEKKAKRKAKKMIKKARKIMAKW